MGKLKRRKSDLAKKAEAGFNGYPIASVCFYGPDNKFASKVTVGIIEYEDQESEDIEMRKWMSGDVDVRYNGKIQQEMLAFIRAEGVKSVVMSDRIMGCPHESGADYPEDESCPMCPFWKNRDRFTHEITEDE